MDKKDLSDKLESNNPFETPKTNYPSKSLSDIFSQVADFPGLFVYLGTFGSLSTIPFSNIDFDQNRPYFYGGAFGLCVVASALSYLTNGIYHKYKSSKKDNS